MDDICSPINRENLIAKLNSILSDSEGSLELGNPKPLVCNLSSKANKSLKNKESYPLIQTALFGFSKLESEKNIGCLSIEMGYIDINTPDEVRYETLELKINYPLKLKGKTKLPKSKMIFTIKHETETWSEISREREDYIKHGIRWKITDLSHTILTNWFLTKLESEVYN